jgi:hypothetical protein
MLLAVGGCSTASPSPTSRAGASQPSQSSVSENASGSEAPSAEPATGRIVFGRYDGLVGDFVVYLIDPNGRGESQLLPGP